MNLNVKQKQLTQLSTTQAALLNNVANGFTYYNTTDNQVHIIIDGIDKVLIKNSGFNTKSVKLITSNYTLQASDEVIIVDSTAGNITITIPIRTQLPNDSYIHEYFVYKNSSDSNIITIQLDGTEKFPLGYSKIELFYAEEFIHFGGNYTMGWSKISTIKTALQTYRSTIWAETKFSSNTPIPFDGTNVLDNDEIFDWNIANPTRLTCKISVRLNLAYVIVINSTGGMTYNVQTKLRKNGVTDIQGSELSSGNYGGEDTSVTLPAIPVKLQTGDYIELITSQTNLTGDLINAIVVMDSII